MGTEHRHYELGVFIGRFQPFHIGHLNAVVQAFVHCDRILICVGSVNVAKTPKNPFDFDTREKFIRSYFSDEENAKIAILPVEDYINDNDWIEAIQKNVKEMGPIQNNQICLVGHKKDESSYYLNIFPQWDFIDTYWMQESKGVLVDAAKIREFWFNGTFEYARAVLNGHVFNYMERMTKYDFHSPLGNTTYNQLSAYYRNIMKYKHSWASAPFAPIFVTTDAVVIQSGHILLVQRAGHPGHGLWALPGGFLEQNERLIDGAIRELIEETNIQLQPKVLKRCLRAVEVIDKPDRSLRGRTITHAHLFRLDDESSLPRVRGQESETIGCKWISFADFKEMKEQMFEDHHEIATQLMGYL